MIERKIKIKSTRVVLPIGSSSLIVVFIVLCMAIFTAITYFTAINEKKLNNQTTEFRSRYYLANEKVSRTLADLQKILDEKKSPVLLMTYDTYPIFVHENSVEFDVAIDDHLLIKVKAEINEDYKLELNSASLHNLNADMVIEDGFLDLFEGDEGFEGFADDFENSGG